MLARVARDKLADACIDASKLYGVAVEMDPRSLHFTQELEEKGWSICDLDLEVLLDGLLVDAVGGHDDLLLLARAQRIVRYIKVDDIALPGVYRLTNDEAATLKAIGGMRAL